MKEFGIDFEKAKYEILEKFKGKIYISIFNQEKGKSHLMFRRDYLPDVVKNIQDYETREKQSAFIQNEKNSLINEQLKKYVT